MFEAIMYQVHNSFYENFVSALSNLYINSKISDK